MESNDGVFIILMRLVPCTLSEDDFFIEYMFPETILNCVICDRQVIAGDYFVCLYSMFLIRTMCYLYFHIEVHVSSPCFLGLDNLLVKNSLLTWLSRKEASRCPELLLSGPHWTTRLAFDLRPGSFPGCSDYKESVFSAGD